MSAQVRRKVGCPECGYRIEMPLHVKLGTQMECEECGELLEVISIDPPELDFAEWDDDWDDEE